MINNQNLIANTMKNLYTILILTAIVFLNACDSKLDIIPRTSIDPDEISVNDIDALLNGCYDGASFGGRQNKHLFLFMEDLSADNLTVRTDGWGTADIDRNDISVTNANVTRWWNHLFVTIYRCNSFLEVINKYDETLFVAGRKKEMIAEARYIRAWTYYQLVTHWGSVPIITTVTNDLVSRDSENDVWNFIAKELGEIENDAPDFSSSSYVSKPAVQIMIARVALIMKDNDKAKSYSEKLIQNKSFELAEDYSSIWRKESKEMIMQWQATINDPLSYGFFLNGSVGRYEFPVDESLVEAFEEGDLRKASSANELKSSIGGYKYECAKYWITGNGDDPWPVSRIAEAYLIHAEASGYPSGIETLNTLRKVRGLGNISVNSVKEFEDAILQERRVELSCEGFRWTDLKRTGRTAEFVPNIKGPDDKNLLYPIPQSALDTNPNLTSNYK